jgi:hypothetical protein
MGRNLGVEEDAHLKEVDGGRGSSEIGQEEMILVLL